LLGNVVGKRRRKSLDRAESTRRDDFAILLADEKLPLEEVGAGDVVEVRFGRTRNPAPASRSAASWSSSTRSWSAGS